MRARTDEALQMLMLTAQRYGVTMTERQADIWLDDLRDLALDYGAKLDDIKAAFRSHIRDPKHGSFMPKLADIMRHLPTKANAYPDASAAWAIALPARDEQNSVCWTPLICEAFFAAKPLLDTGDKFAARQAFVSFYDRAVLKDKARPHSERVAKWVMAYGFDAEMRGVVEQAAKAQGLLSCKSSAPMIEYTPSSELPPEELRMRVQSQLKKLTGTFTALTIEPQEIKPTAAPMPAVQKIRAAA